MKSPGVVSTGATSLGPHKGEGRGRRTSWHCQSVSTRHQQRPWQEGKPLTKDNLIQFYNSCSWILCSKYTLYMANMHHHAFTKSRERTREWLLAHKCALGGSEFRTIKYYLNELKCSVFRGKKTSHFPLGLFVPCLNKDNILGIYFTCKYFEGKTSEPHWSSSLVRQPINNSVILWNQTFTIIWKRSK